MRGLRRPIVAVLAASVLVVVEAVVDPTGLLALVGWPGGTLQAELVWPLAPYAVFVPVLLGVVWWAAVRAGERFWTMFAGVVLAVLLAQAAAAFVMVWDAATAGWAAGYVTAKALPAAAVVAAATRWLGGSSTRPTFEPGSVWPAAVACGALAPIAAGSWWTGAAYAPLVPAPRPERGIVLVVVAVVMMVGAAWVCLRWMRRRVPGLLGVWLGVLAGGALFGLGQALIALLVDDGLAGDLWPVMVAYVHMADGMSFAACLGWIPGVLAVVVDRAGRAASARSVTDADAAHRRPRRGPAIAATAIVVAALIIVPVLLTGGGVAEDRAQAQGAASVPDGFLRADGDRITDGEGHDVLLRGVNVNQLVDFYQPRAEVPATRPLTEDDFAGMAAYGFDVVRLGISWSTLEPVRGELDAGYLERIDQAIEWAKDHGIRTVIDLHQDSWSNAATAEGTVCRPGTDPMWGYDGAPRWATITDGAPRCAFTGRDISPAGDRAFQHFWFDTDGIQSALVRTWGELAGRYADEPAVAGFDLMNEPGFGETAPVTTSLLLGQYYDRAIQAIRDAGAPQIVFIEPSILWSGLGFDSGPSLAFTDDANIVFSPHLYAESITMDHSLGLPTIVGVARQLDLAARVADEYGVPLWSGEYGYWGDEESIANRIGRYADAEDAHLLGSAYWVWKQSCGDPQNGIGEVGLGLVPEDCATGEDGPRNAELLGTLSRAYPLASPGRLTGLDADGAAIAMTGRVGAPTCGLDVWIPGAVEPHLVTEGLTQVVIDQVEGGWHVSACADGGYSLTNPPANG